MSKEKLREGGVIALIVIGFAVTLYLIFKIKSYAGIDFSAASEDKIAMVKSSIHTTLVIGGLIIGGIMGAVVQRSKFCIAAACHARITIGDLFQTRSYAMALFVAILGTQILYKMGQVDIQYSIYVSSPFTWLGYIIGGFTFGVGIVYTGGCASRILVRAAEGDLGSMGSVMAFILASGATLWGILAYVRVDYLNSLTLGFKSQYLPEIFSSIPWWLILLALEIILLVFMLMAPKDSEWWGWQWPSAGAAIGLTIVFAWWINGAAHLVLPHIDSFSFTGPADPTLLQKWRPKSLTFALADAESFRYIILWTGETINFAIATVFGVLAGSFLAARISGSFNWVAPQLQQFKFNLFGGLLMGFGAVVGLGCNIGQGLSGISTMSLGSILTMTFIALGAMSAAKFMLWQVMRD
ncbi:putative inner membrane protein [bacterium BMS3Bbin14]|nr:putative inner membrane protein [bacterium BMS3Abin13]GBE52680.1 putative inner membrane protein [bacterium BMS3Bbin14]HDK44392.1 YeeE/YedE family protein [Desulfobacteraceae bacterium]HDL98007.1 YeeE/YedE family protein [Desulfobacteraceae bacterium]